MNDASKADISKLYDAMAEEYSRQYQRENLDTSARYPANYFRLQLQVQRLAECGLRRIYEVGVGEGTPLITLSRLGFQVAGCDISESMVTTARKNFSAAGLNEKLVQWGDIEDSTTLQAPIDSERYDAVIAAGVLPHITNDTLFLKNMKMLLRPGGKVLIEFRNKLFSLFTFNRHTRDFIINDLLAGVDEEVRLAVAKDLEPRLRLDQPVSRPSPGKGAKSYDAILAKFHNPFELKERLERSGFCNVQFHWYHYHPAFPYLEAELGTAFRKSAMRLEHDTSWRGMFLCSAGVIEGDLVT
jgi:2-polyprenyl-3-methyl-5-hydroxy-6-metoxy-1,4-benzoquinol methylase